LDAARFDGKKGFQFLILPAGQNDEWEVVSAVANVAELSPWCLARLAEALPQGRYRLAEGEPGPAALGWLLGQHRFNDYKSAPEADRGARVLLTREAAGIEQIIRLADATAKVRDLVDTPAADLGPGELEEAARSLAKEFGAKIEVTSGDALAQGYPMIAAVGQGAASDRAPRLIELRWGKESAPHIAIVGKGVCFDSGGLDLKPASGMRMMKKDMGGAALMLALAQMIMDAGLKIRLRLLIPAVENSVSGNAYRPLDVIKTRKGITVEIGNTDAEGRLILCDALAEACNDKPDLILDCATLTGAARVALGPELPALFCNSDATAEALLRHGAAEEDALWRLPLHQPYRRMLDSKVADLNNVSESGFAGAITAALFLKEFVDPGIAWAHID
ncbi:MAG: leucyl aminopeptidase family protein, partial [Sphingomicrobium sp.]